MTTHLFLFASLVAQEGGWGGSQEPSEPEPPASEETEPQQPEQVTQPEAPPVDPAQPDLAEPMGFVMPELLEIPAIPWPAGVPYVDHQVELLLLLDTQGQVAEVTPVAGQEPFLSLAVEAAPHLGFTPAMENGEPIEVELPFSWNFPPPPENLLVQLVVAGDGSAARVSLLLDGQLVGETDEMGRFGLRELAPGEHTIEIVDPSLRLAPVIFTLGAGEVAEVQLVADAQGSDQVALGTYRRQQSEVVTRSLSATELRTTPGTMGDPVRAVQNLPGVVRTPFDSGWLIVRGGAPRDTGVFIDGQRVPLVYHLGGFTSVLHPAMVEQVDFMPGGYGPRYGRSIAGAVDLTSRTLDPGVTRVEAGADLVHAGAFVQVPLGEDVSMAASLRRSYLDRIVSAVSSPEQAAIVPRFYDWSARVDGENAGVLYLGYRDAIDAPTGLDGDTVRVTIRTHRVLGRIEKDTALGALSVRPVFADDTYYLDFSDDQDIRNSTSGALRLQLDAPDDAPWGYQLGLDGELTDYSISVGTDCPDDGDCPSVTKGSWMASADPYLSLRFGDAKGTHLVVGGRLDTLYVDGQQLRWAPSPRASAVVQASKRWQLVGDAGIYHQYPPIEWAVGLPTGRYLDLEQSRGVGAGARWRGRQVSFEADAYYRLMEDLTIFESDGSTGQGQGKAYGVETLSRWAYGDFSGWVAYTYSRSLRRDEPGDGWVPFTYDQPHYFVAVAAWSLPKNWSLSGRFRVGSGYPREPDSDDALDILTQTEVPLDTSSARLQPYHALDLKVARLQTLEHWELEYYLDIQNVYNRRVPEPVITGIDDRNTAYGFGLMTLPIFGVKGAFVRDQSAPP